MAQIFIQIIQPNWMSIFQVRIGRHLAVLTAVILLASCAPIQDTVHETASPPEPLVWPLPPEIPRILYETSIHAPEDMQIRPGFWERFWNYLTGKTRLRLISPFSVAADDPGTLYVVDSFLRKTILMDQRHTRTLLFPDGNQPMVSPVGIAIDGENRRIFVSDSTEGVVKIFSVSESGQVLPTGELNLEMYERPTGIAVNRITSELLVVDTGKSTVYRVDLNSGNLLGKIGNKGTGCGEFNRPTAVCVDGGGRIIVTDALNCRVQIFSVRGQFLGSFGSAGDGPGHFARPRGVATDSDDNIYVVDALFDNVQIFDKLGRLLLAFGAPGQKAGEFWLPAGICITPDDTIFIADSYNKRVQVFRYLKEGRSSP